MNNLHADPADQSQKPPVARFAVQASVGNADGVFDAAYDFGLESGEEAAMSGTPQEIGQAIARFLSRLSTDDCEAMKYGTPRFFVRFDIDPDSFTPNQDS